jgi:hypothetical protein
MQFLLLTIAVQKHVIDELTQPIWGRLVLVFYWFHEVALISDINQVLMGNLNLAKDYLAILSKISCN